jgi:hypothetical protein
LYGLGRWITEFDDFKEVVVTENADFSISLVFRAAAYMPGASLIIVFTSAGLS